MTRTKPVSSRPAPSLAFVPLPERPAAGASVAAELPGPAHADRVLRELAGPLAELAEQCRGAGPADGGALVLLTGCQRGAGCSTLAWALARAAAGRGPALLLDADLSSPGLSALAGEGLGGGWADSLQGRCPLEQALRRDPGRDLAFLPLREPVGDPGAVLAHPGLPLWLARLRRDFGLVLLDGGPLVETGTGWTSWVDAAVLVCDAGLTPPRDRAQAWDWLEAGGTRVLGIVEMFV